MESKAINILYQEHDHILLALESLQGILERNNAEEMERSLPGVISFLKEYGDLFHHQKEEEYLFPLLGETNPMMQAMIDELEEHHKMFREHLEEAESSLGENGLDECSRLLNEYLKMLRDHIHAENDELFVAANELLEEGTLERMYFSFRDKDLDLGEELKSRLEASIVFKNQNNRSEQQRT